MKHLISEVKQQQLEWRRSQVLELASQGYSQREIAKEHQIDLTAVNRDIHFLRQQAQDNLQKHIQEAVPEEYQMARIGINQVLKMAWSIANKDIDNRTNAPYSPYLRIYRMVQLCVGLPIMEKPKKLNRL